MKTILSQKKTEVITTVSTLLLTLCMCICLTSVVKGQTRNDVMFVNYAFAPSTKFQKIEGKSSLFNSIEVQLGMPPKKLGDRLKLINSFYLKSFNYNFENLSNQYQPIQKQLYDLRFTPLLLYKINSKWSAMAMPTVMLRSDFLHNFSSKDLFYNGLLLANYNPDGNNRVTFSFGVILTNDLTHNQFNPAVNFTFKGKKLTIEAGYPRTNILFKPKKKMEWGITIAVDGATFNIKDEKLSDSSITAHNVRTVDLFTGQALNFNLYGRIWFNTQIGYAFLRHYDLLDSEYKAIKSAKTDLQGSFYAKAGISIRFGN